MANRLSGADNGGRTRDTKLGKLVLYQLSYVRTLLNEKTNITKRSYLSRAHFFSGIDEEKRGRLSRWDNESKGLQERGAGQGVYHVCCQFDNPGRGQSHGKNKYHEG